MAVFFSNSEKIIKKMKESKKMKKMYKSKNVGGVWI